MVSCSLRASQASAFSLITLEKISISYVPNSYIYFAYSILLLLLLADKGQILYLLFLFVFGDASSLRVHFAESCRMELSPSDKPGIQFKATQSCYTNHTIVGIVFYLL